VEEALRCADKRTVQVAKNSEMACILALKLHEPPNCHSNQMLIQATPPEGYGGTLLEEKHSHPVDDEDLVVVRLTGL